MKNILIASFILLVLVQWFVPGNMICNKEKVVKKGRSFRFETEPVDPADPFRGRYMILDFKMDTFRVKSMPEIDIDRPVYVLLENDANGFARIQNVVFSKPANQNDYVIANAYVSRVNDDFLIYVTYPFEEFYLEEFKAPKAEQEYFESTRDSTKKTYAVVKVFNGDAVIENVYINDKPLVQ
jgi:uncharacterized membrane-anchored protein